MSDWIIETITTTGYLGIFLMMVLENIFPPIPSELIMPFAGYVAAQGQLSLVGVIIAGTVGSVVGTLPWYWAGKKFGDGRLRKMAANYGRVMTVTPEEVTQAGNTFRKYGPFAVFFGRLIPAIRTLISIPAGVTRMPFVPFLAYSTLGSALWVSLLTGAGHMLGRNQHLVADYLDPGSKIVVGIVLVVYLYRLITFRGAAKS